MSGLLQRDDGSWGLVDSNGFVEDFDMIEMPHSLEGLFGLPEAYIDIEPTCVVDTEVAELPERQAFVGPPTPTRMPEGLPTVEAMDQFVAAVREWGES